MRFLKIIPYILVPLTVCFGTTLYAEPLDKVVAVVNQDVISEIELEQYTKLLTMDAPDPSVLPPKSILRRQVLNKFILDKLQLQLASEMGLEVDSVTVSQAIKQLAEQQNKSVEQFRKDIEANDIDFAQYRDMLKGEIAIQHVQSRMVSQDVIISKNDIESYLNSPAGQDQSGTEYKLGHILILPPETPTPAALKETQDKANAIVSKLKAGANFSQTAMESSSGQQALKGGDLGWRTVGELPTLFVGYVPSMKIGDVAGPIRSASGFHIVKLLEKRAGDEELLTETHVRQILMKPSVAKSDDEVRVALMKIRQQIISGADFAELAQQKSEETRTGPKGGDMGWVTKKSVLPKFFTVMSGLDQNQISEPFKTDAGWHLIEVLGERTHKTSSAAAWNKAKQILSMRKMNELLETWTKRLRDEASVEVLLADDSNS